VNVERIKPTRENLYSYLKDYPEHQLRYDLISEFIKGKDCADISCGVGYGTFMAGEFANTVKGYDVSVEALDYANKNFTRDNVSFHALEDLQDEQFEFISSIETLEHMSENDGDTFLQKISNSLNVTGTLLISTPLNETKYKENTTQFHIREYSYQEFKDKLENNGFSIHKIYGISNIVSERMSSNLMGFSLMSILNSGMHRLIPSSLRTIIARALLKKDAVEEIATSCALNEDSLKGAFCQIAICKKK
tara:strand:+ start:1181 stop:1927 length:747 start_codon:yes stop_codon:yes gene_type:complete